MSKNTILSKLPNVNGIVKGSTSGTSGFTTAVANVDYQVPVVLTTLGNSGASTFDGTTLNIPQYAGGGTSSGTSGTSGTSGASGTSGTSGVNGANGTNGTSGADGSSGTSGTSGVSGISGGTVNTVPKFTAATTIGNSAITDDGTIVTLVSRALSVTGNTIPINGMYSSSANVLNFATASANRLQIDSGGNYTFNTGNVTLNSQVYNNLTSPSVRTLFIGGNFVIGGLSSIRASKKNIIDISNINWLYDLNTVSFNYRKKDEKGNYTEEIYDELAYGLIAEDTAPIADFLINYNEKEDGTKDMIGIEYSRLITPMLKAIQEQKIQIQNLQEQINILAK